MTYILIAVALFGSFLLTRQFIYMAYRLGILDTPNERSSHEVVTPRGGGISFVIIFSICISIMYAIGSVTIELYLSFIVGGLVVGGIGLWDDYSHVNVGVRLFVHFLAAITALVLMGSIQFIQVYDFHLQLGWFGYLLSLFLIVWLLNLFNFMDGIDGLAAIEAIFVASSAAVILLAGTDNKINTITQIASYDKTMISLLLILSFSVLGFLIFNWSPAKIFMGDVGSGFLGFVLGVLVIATTMAGKLTIWTWMILLGIFIVDATSTLIRRIIEGERWYEAHQSHAYQHAAKRWNSHRKITLSVLSINILWLFPLGWLAAIKPEWGASLTAGAYIPLILLAFYLNAGKSQ